MNASNMHFDDRALVSYVMSCPLPTMSQKLKYKVSLNIYAPLPTPKSKSAQTPPLPQTLLQGISVPSYMY